MQFLLFAYFKALIKPVCKSDICKIKDLSGIFCITFPLLSPKHFHLLPLTLLPGWGMAFIPVHATKREQMFSYLCGFVPHARCSLSMIITRPLSSKVGSCKYIQWWSTASNIGRAWWWWSWFINWKKRLNEWQWTCTLTTQILTELIHI